MEMLREKHPVKQNQKNSESSPLQNKEVSVVGRSWCCNPPTNPCCPEINLLSDDTILINDDYGNSIKLDRDSIKDVISKVSKILQ